MTITIDAKGRDNGKVFLLTEMSAVAAEKWATRAICALMNTGVEIPPDIATQGMAGLSSMGMQAIAKLPYYALEPLMADLMTCVQMVPNPQNPAVVRAVLDDDFEEVATIFNLKKEVVDLHTGFFTAASKSTTAPVVKRPRGS